MHFLIIQSKAEVVTETAIQAVEAITKFRNLSLPPLVKGYLAKKYEGTTKELVASVEKECADILQKLVDSSVILPYLSKDDCFAVMNEYTLWAIKEKAKLNGTDFVGAETLIDKLKEVRNGKVRHFLNINDLKDVLPAGSVPENFVVWVTKEEFGNACIGGSEFNKQYKYLCIYK